MESVNCNLCGSGGYRALFSSPDFTFPKAERFQVARCAKCSLVFINPRPDKSEIGNYYPADYFRCYEEIKSESEAIQEKKVKIASSGSSGRILDVGCGRGEFLAKMKEKGWEVYGVELSPVAASYARDKLGLENIYNGDLLEVALPENFFDEITLWHVIEHLTDPSAALRKIHGLLKDDGSLIINCPNFNSVLRRIFREKWYQLDAPRHLYQFTPRTLGIVLEKCGFAVKDINYLAFPLYPMIWLKLSVFRWLGLVDLMYSEIKAQDDENRAKRRGAAWIFFRGLFNFICRVVVISLGLLQMGDDMCIKAEKIRKQ